MKELYTYSVKNTELTFKGPDLANHYRINLKKNSESWIYRKKQISYRYNSFGFRTYPFEDINWKDSVLVLGCSNVEGIGLAKEDTLVEQLEKIIERPVINLGVAGSGVDIACWNSAVLYESFPAPAAIIQLWTSLGRYTDIIELDNNRIIKANGYLPQLSDYDGRLNWENRSIMYVLTDRLLWKNKTTYLEGSFFDDTSEKLDIDYFPRVDVARDMGHPGIDSNLIAAQKLAEKLKQHNI